MLTQNIPGTVPVEVEPMLFDLKELFFKPLMPGESVGHWWTDAQRYSVPSVA